MPFFAQWKGVLEQGIDIPALTAHIDLYQTANLPETMQDLEGRSLLPLLETKKAK